MNTLILPYHITQYIQLHINTPVHFETNEIEFDNGVSPVMLGLGSWKLLQGVCVLLVALCDSNYIMFICRDCRSGVGFT